MVNLNWDLIKSVSIDDIGDEEISQLYPELIGIDPEDETNLENLRLLFRISQAIMQAKGIQAEVALEELEQMTQKLTLSSNSGQILNNGTDELLQEIETLKAELAKTGRGNGDKTTHELEKQIEKLRIELQEKDRKLAYEANEAERCSLKVVELEKSKKELEIEISYIKEELDECKSQLVNQSFSDHHVINKDQDHSMKIREKNKEISKLLEEIEFSEQENGRLQNQLINLRDKLSESTNEMDKTTAEYIKLKNELRRSEDTLEVLREENVKLKLQVTDLIQQNQARMIADDEIIAAVNARVEEWKAVLAGKDALIIKLQNEVKQQQESLPITDSGFKGITVNILSKAIDERDKQIAQLKHHLQEATLYLEENTAIIENLKDKRTDRPDDWQLSQIISLQKKLTQLETQELDLKHRLEDAESHAQEKDKELTEALSKLSQYEHGEYGLAEAVQEIKDYKLQLHFRDKQIEDVTRLLNHTEMALGELKEENEELYKRVGVSPKKLVYEEIQDRVAKKQQKERTLNKVLQKEIENLEEERIVLKKDIRKLAQIVGIRASNYNLTVEDAKLLQTYAEKLSDKNTMDSDVDITTLQTKEMLMEITQLVKQLQNDVEITQKKMSEVKSSSSYTRPLVEVQSLSQEEEEIVQLLKEFRCFYSTLGIESQISLLKQALLNVQSDDNEATELASGLNSKAEIGVDREELENNLSQAEEEIRSLIRNLTESNNKVEQLQLELDNFRNKKEFRDYEENMEPLIRINDHILYYIKKLEQSGSFGIDAPLMPFGVEKEYKDQKLLADCENLHKEKAALEDELSEKTIKVEEYEKLLDVLSKSDISEKMIIADLNRKLTVLKVSERRLKKQYSLILEDNLHLNEQINNLQSEILAIQGATLHRVNYLEHFKEIAIFKIASLHRTLENSVPSSQHKTLATQYSELMKKYQQLLEKAKNTSQILAQYHMPEEIGYSEEGLFNKDTRAVLEKLNALESVIVQPTHEGDTCMEKKVALLELKSLNEQQRADHAVSVIEEYKSTIKKLEQRNAELQEKFTKLTEIGSEQQRVEEELRLSLEECVSKDEYDRIAKVSEELEAQNIILRKEITQLKEISQIASNQLSLIENRHSAKLEEMKRLEWYLEVKNDVDNRALIGKLYRQLVKVQMNETALQHKLNSCQNQLQKIEALSLRLEKRCDEKDLALHHYRNEYGLKINRLQQTAQNLRHKLQGSISLVQQESFTMGLLDIQEKKMKLERELEQINSQKYVVQDKICEFEEKTNILEELIGTLKSGSSAEKLLEWHHKILSLRVQEKKCVHQIERLSRESEYMKELAQKQEELISSLEKKVVDLEADSSEQQFVWESRELELERTVSRLESRNFSNKEDIDVSFLEHMEQYKDLDKKTKTMEIRIRELEMTINAQNKVIDELQSKNQEISSTPVLQSKTELLMNFSAVDPVPSLKIAQTVVEGLKARLMHKEETIVKYQDLLQQARNDLEEIRQSSQVEIEAIRSKMHNQATSALMQFREELKNSLSAHSSMYAAEQMGKLNELQEVALQQDTAIALLTDKLKASSKEIWQWQLKNDTITKEFLHEKEKMKEEYETNLLNLEHQLNIHKTESLEKDDQLKQIQLELESQLDKIKKTPSAMLKMMVEQLKRQLEVKERQIQSLSNALEELKKEMKSTVEEKFVPKPADVVEQQSIMSLLQQQKVLQEQLDATLQENDKLKKSVRKDVSNAKEVMKIKEELEKQRSTIADMKKEKQNLEKINCELEAKVKKFVRTEQHTMLESNMLRSKLKTLEEKLALCHIAEKPYDKPKDEQTNHKAYSVETWEEIKKWQQMVSKLKSKLSTKEVECTSLEKNLATAKSVILRLENEKATLEKKGKQVQHNRVESSSNNYEAFNQLYSSTCALEDEITELKRQLFVEKDLKLEELGRKNRLLTEKVDELTLKLQANSPCASPRKVSNALVNELNSLKEREENLQKEILQLSQENLGLKFEVEQGSMRLPQYIDRISHLEKYINALKSESKCDHVDTPSIQLQKPRAGMNDRNSRDLEKTVDVLKKVIDKLQQENQRLKNSSQEISKNNQIIQEENSRLKERLGIISNSLDSCKLQELYESQTSKIVAHNERLLNDLQREVKTNETLRMQLHECKMQNEKLRQRVTEVEEKLENYESQHPKLACLGGEKWKAQAVARLYEDKLAVAEKNIQQKTKVIEELKNLLNEAILMEDQFLKSRGRLQQTSKEQSTIKSRYQRLRDIKLT